MHAQELIDRLERQDTFKATVERLESHWAEPVERYRCKRAIGPSTGVRAVKDSVWGVVQWSGRESYVLDSPVLQRLRRIHQLGVSYVTYPSATHSRFEHTIGAMHQAERMLRAIAGRSAEGSRDENVRVTDAELLEHLPLVRLAAMLHDLGHLPFSHLCERFYDPTECPDPALSSEAATLRREVGQALGLNSGTLGRSSLSLSECLVLCLCLTPSVRELIVDGAGYSLDQLARALCAIAGRAPSPSTAFVAQLMSNVVDADKLDYMFRDSLATNVPLGVDLERVLHKLVCRRVRAHLLSDAFRRVLPANEDALVLCTDPSGHRLAMDLALGRSMLYERVYYHHKTRAAEQLVLRILDDLRPHPAELLCEDDGFFGPYGPLASDPAEPRAHLARALALRELPRRVFAWSQEFLQNQGELDQLATPHLADDDQLGLMDLDEAVKSPVARRELEVEITAEARRLAGILEVELPAERVWVESPPKEHERGEYVFLLETPDGELSERKHGGLRSIAPAHTHNPARTAYVFAHGSLQSRLVCYIATELVFARRFKLQFGREAADFAKVPYAEVEKLKRELEALDPSCFSDAGALRPRAALPQSGEGQQRVQAVAEKLKTYQVPPAGRMVEVGEVKQCVADLPPALVDQMLEVAERWLGRPGAGITIDADRVTRFLDQFPEGLVEPMLAALEAMTILGRADLGTDLSRFLRDERPDSIAVPLLADPTRSATHLSYFLADDEHAWTVGSLDQALAKEGPITFFDDWIISGIQACEVLAEMAPQLATKSLRFRFAYGTPQGMQRLRDKAAELGLEADVDAARVEEEVGQDLAPGTELAEFLREVGLSLLRTSDLGWDEDKLHDRALGYGNCARMLASPYGLPTSTVTALWKSGRYRNQAWLPLLPRRGEL